MPSYSPIQEAFNAGEVSRRFSAQTSSALYKRALSYDQNFIPTPQGSLLRRAGTQDRGLFADVLRVIPFEVAGSEPFSVLLSSSAVTGYMRVLDSNGNVVPLYNNLVKNGSFHSGVVAIPNSGGWSDSGGGGVPPTVNGAVSPFWNAGGYMHLVNGEYVQQSVLLTGGANYTLRFRAKSADSGPITVSVHQVGGAGLYPLNVTVAALTPTWQNLTYNFTCAVGGYYYLTFSAGAGASDTADLDDVVITDDSDLGGWDGTGVDQKIVTPWTADAIPYVQFDQDNAKNVMVLTQPKGIRTLTLTSHGLWFLRTLPWVNKPAEWVDNNYPAAIEHGYQGRLWLAGSPDQPNTFRASKSGSPFDFTTGNNDADSMSWNASLRGAIRWMRGHLSLLIGAEKSEQSANGNGGVITPGNPPEVRDESVFGSARKQIAMAGDEVLFVPKDGNGVRALSFDALGKNGWVSNPVSYLAHHLVKNVKELHFAYSPEPTLVVTRNGATMLACTYKKDQQGLITAWFRTDLLALSVAVLETTAGSVLRMLVARADGTHVEDLPLHEASIDYLDSWSTVVADGDGRLTGLARFNGQNVRVKQDGVSIGVYAVAGGIVDLGAEYAGVSVVVGLTYLARVVTLPLEGGDPTGTSQGKAVHWSEVAVRLNESARPKLNGERAGFGKPFGPSFDALEALLTADVRASTLEVSEGGQITIEQEEPYRTEICGLFGQAGVSRV